MVIVCGFSLKTGALRRGKPLPRRSQPAAFRGGSSAAPRRRGWDALLCVSCRCTLGPGHGGPGAGRGGARGPGGPGGTGWRWRPGFRARAWVSSQRTERAGALCQPGCTGGQWECGGQAAAPGGRLLLGGQAAAPLRPLWEAGETVAAGGKAGGAAFRVRAPTGAGPDGRCTVFIAFTVGASETATQPARVSCRCSRFPGVQRRG